MRNLRLDTGHLTDEELGINTDLARAMREPSPSTYDPPKCTCRRHAQALDCPRHPMVHRGQHERRVQRHAPWRR